MKKVIGLFLVLIILLSLSGCGGSSVSKTYNTAQKELAKGEYEKAAELFESINTYEDSSKLAVYSKALAYGNHEDYAKAKQTLEFLGEFKDSQQLIQYYSICELAQSGVIGNLFSAAEQFDAISAYRDSANRAEACRQLLYDEGVSRLNNGDYDNARSIFNNLGSYKDSESQVLACDKAKTESEKEDAYTKAEEMLVNKDYIGAIAAFQSLGDYKDSAKRAEEITDIKNKEIYPKAELLFSEKDYDGAIKEYIKVFNYLDSEDKIIQCCKQLYTPEHYYFQALTIFAKLNDVKGVRAVLDDLCAQYSIGNILECFVFDDNFGIVHETEDGYEYSVCLDYIVGYLSSNFSVKGKYDSNKGYHDLFEAVVAQHRADARYVFDFR